MFHPVISQDLRYFLRLWRPWRSLLVHHELESVHFGKEKFLANLDVQHFKPENISIKVSDDNLVTVEGKHEEKQEGEGTISRQFIRKFVLPKGHDISKLESRLSSDGILTITAPRLVKEEDAGRKIPIQHTGKPHESKNEEK